MPKWIISSKRWRPKTDRGEADEAAPQEKALHKGGSCSSRKTNGTSSSSDSGLSLSPVGSSSSEQDWRERAVEIYLRSRSCGQLLVSSTSEEADNVPLDLSLKSQYHGKSGPRTRHVPSLIRVREGLYGGRSEERKALELSLDSLCGFDMRVSGKLPLCQRMDATSPTQVNRIMFQTYEDMLQFDQQYPLPVSTSEARSKGKAPTARRRPLSRNTDNDDSEGHVVEAQVTQEAIAMLERIENKIGEYNCKLCDKHFANAFDLANHNCSGIERVEHRCSECDKVFQCPANLASHRRWHGPRASNPEPSWHSATEASPVQNDVST